MGRTKKGKGQQQTLSSSSHNIDGSNWDTDPNAFEDDVIDEIITPNAKAALSTGIRPSELNRPRATKTLIEQIEERKAKGGASRKNQSYRETRQGNIRIIDAGSVGKKPKRRNEDNENYNDGGIPDDEKMRLIRESGLLKKINYDDGKSGKDKHKSEADEEEDYIFHAIIYTIPFCTIYAIMDTLIHRQYNQEGPPIEIIQRLLKAIPLFLIMIYYSNRYRKNIVVKSLLPIISSASGCYLLHLINTSPAYGIMRQCPGLATIWIYTVFLMDLLPTVGSLAGVGIFYWFATPPAYKKP